MFAETYGSILCFSVVGRKEQKVERKASEDKEMYSPNTSETSRDWPSHTEGMDLFQDNMKRKVQVSVTQSCLTLCDPVACSPSGSSVHGVLQARVLEWVPKPSSRDLPSPGTEPASTSLQVDSLLSEPPGKCLFYILVFWPRGTWDVSFSTRYGSHTSCMGK